NCNNATTGPAVQVLLASLLRLLCSLVSFLAPPFLLFLPSPSSTLCSSCSILPFLVVLGCHNLCRALDVLDLLGSERLRLVHTRFHGHRLVRGRWCLPFPRRRRSSSPQPFSFPPPVPSPLPHLFALLLH